MKDLKEAIEALQTASQQLAALTGKPASVCIMVDEAAPHDVQFFGRIGNWERTYCTASKPTLNECVAALKAKWLNESMRLACEVRRLRIDAAELGFELTPSSVPQIAKAEVNL